MSVAVGRLVAVLLVTLGAALAAAAPALAGTASVVSDGAGGSKVRFQDTGIRDNQVTIDFLGNGIYSVSDGEFAITPGVGCVPAPADPTPATPHEVRCTDPDGFYAAEVLAGAGDDRVDALGGTAYRLLGGSGTDTIAVSGTTPAVLDGGTGPDFIYGGDGVDTLDYSSRTAPVSASLTGFTSGNGQAAENDYIGGGIDDLRGGSAADKLYGNSGPNMIDGNGGGDAIEGWGGGDTLNGGNGADTIGSSVGTQADTMDGGDGTDTVSYAGHPGPVVVALGDAGGDGAEGENDSLTGFENLTGSAADGGDTLTGDAGPNLIKGLDGDDLLDGDAGADTLNGGAGVDTITYEGRAGSVAIRLDNAANDGADPDGDGTSADAEERDRDIGVERATGGSANDRLFGSPSPNRLRGGPGDDILDGGRGSDTLDGGDGTDTMTYITRTADKPVFIRLDTVRNDGLDADASGGSSAAEEADQDLSIENATGGFGDDRIIGNPRLNVLHGGNDGDDTLQGKDGSSLADQLICGAGADKYTADPSDTRTSCETLIP